MHIVKSGSIKDCHSFMPMDQVSLAAFTGSPFIEQLLCTGLNGRTKNQSSWVKAYRSTGCSFEAGHFSSSEIPFVDSVPTACQSLLGLVDSHQVTSVYPSIRPADMLM